MDNHKKHLEIKLTDDGNKTSMTAHINVGINTDAEMLDEMILTFEKMRKGLYKQARAKVKQYEKERKEVTDGN